MQSFPPTLILRHRLENLKKCSLRGLESRPDCVFLTYPRDSLPDLTNFTILSFDGPVLSEEDNSKGLLILDATWRYAAKMAQLIAPTYHINYRSLPVHYRTAYPRKQADCSDPNRGLASIEALYLSYYLLRRPTNGLLDNYYWKDQFLQINQLSN